MVHITVMSFSYYSHLHSTRDLVFFQQAEGQGSQQVTRIITCTSLFFSSSLFVTHSCYSLSSLLFSFCILILFWCKDVRKIQHIYIRCTLMLLETGTLDAPYFIILTQIGSLHRRELCSSSTSNIQRYFFYFFFIYSQNYHDFSHQHLHTNSYVPAYIFCCTRDTRILNIS